MEQLIREIGQLFVIGFSGDHPSEAFLNFISEEQIGGVILFAENCPTHACTWENIDRIRQALPERPPFIAVDQEGGTVCRVHGAPAEYRSAREYGRDDSTERFVEEYARAAVFLESLGFNLNLAPVADICSAGNDWLKERCFGDTPETVKEFVRASVETSHAAGLLCCVKHFPGVGASRLDPHEKTARADYDQIVWEQRERIPFAAAVEAGVDLVMTTHLHLPRIDETIVTGSQTVVRQMLRNGLAFDGPVITDDLTMAGAAVLGTVGERTVAAFRAGHDMLLFGQDLDAAAEAYECFVGTVRRGEIDEHRLRASLARVAGLKYKLEQSIVR